MSERARTVIATAGHVDHGKTALVRALTGTDTDRLPEEKRRGISIELGFAELAEQRISFIDVPGHRKLVHAMIAGVGGVDGALVVVAADDGVMPQTREHLWALALLGIERVVVAISKADLVDAETLELAEEDIRSTLRELGLSAVAVIPTSVVSRQGLGELERALEALAGAVPARGASARLWLPVDRVFSIKGAGTVITGTLTRGELSLGDPIWVTGERGTLASACRSLEIHGVSVDRARAPTRVAVNLARLELDDVRRGDVLTKDSELAATRRFDAALRLLPGAERVLGERGAVVVHAGTHRATGRVTLLGPKAGHVALDAPLPVEGGVGVVLRGFRSTRDHGAVLAGGRVADGAAPPLPRRRDQATRARRAQLIEAAAQGELGTMLGHLLDLSAPVPVSSGDVERRFGLEPGDVARTLAGKKRKGPSDAISLADGELFTTARALDGLLSDLERRLGDHHERHPLEPGASLETLRSQLATRIGRELAELVLSRALAQKRVVQIPPAQIALPSFAERTGGATRESAARLLALLSELGLEGVSEAAAAARSGESAELVRIALGRLANEGKARRLGGLWFAELALERLRATVRDHLAQHGSLSVPTFKDIAGVSRKQAIPLLEQLDREGTTRRQGDLRVAGARSA